MSNNTSPHFLNTSANLLGFCLIIITSVHLTNQSASSIIDNCAAVIALSLALSCFLSFIAIRIRTGALAERFETIADYFFIVSLTGILVLTFLISFSII